MTESIPKNVRIGGVILALFFLVYLAYFQPEYFTNPTNIEALLALELVGVAIWMYRRVFFPIILLAFLFAGTGLGPGLQWTAARWLVLGVGGFVGCVIMVRERIKDRYHHFGLFHAFAFFAILASLISAAVSQYPEVAFLKGVSLLLLFVYGATGARLAVAGRENRFFTGLLTGCEVFVGVMAVLYLFGGQEMGNPNSLGAVMAIVATPILLWGAMQSAKGPTRYRRFLLYAICICLIFYSQSRASLGAAFACSAVFLLALRKYRFFVQCAVLILVPVLAAAIFNYDIYSSAVSSVNSSVLYKGKVQSDGLLGSRLGPWQAAVDTIRENPWFGTGFGTTEKTQQFSGQFTGDFSPFATARGVSGENGSSYLSIVEWVGLLGIAPFLFLLLMIVKNILRTVRWMLNTGNPSHPAIPLAMVMVASLLHAAFEDWLFAPGYYLCVFFWSLAFIFVDLAPQSPL